MNQRGSHDMLFVSWALPSAALQIQQLDMSNLDWATVGVVLVEKNPRHKKRVVATGIEAPKQRRRS
jgi:hypothetical protein